MRTIASVFLVISAILICLSAFHVLSWDYDTDKLSLGFVLLSAGAALFGRVWLKDDTKKNRNDK
jgi:hypothetical protein